MLEARSEGTVRQVSSRLQNPGAILGVFFGPLIAAFIVDHTESYRWAIAFALAMAAAGFVAIVPLKRRR